MTEVGFNSLIPIIVALVLCLGTRNVILGLFCGVFTGVVMLNGLEPFAAMAIMVKSHLIPQLTDSYNAGVLILLAFIGGFVALVEQSGGGAAFAIRINQWVKSPIQAQMAAWFGGIAIFFSDLGTPLIVGPVFRPLMDRLKVSRQKLAFIIDSTASPVAILVPFIGWGVYIMSLIYQEYTALGIEESEFSVFVQTIAFQFYAWLAITMVPLLAVFKFDFAAMARVERSTAIPVHIDADTKEAFSHPNARPILVWGPLLVMAVVLGIMLVPLGFPFTQISGTDFRAGLSTAY
ncbi:MAG: Na+/H+ antiporter NhaC, partial [Paraglaciecola sp.]